MYLLQELENRSCLCSIKSLFGCCLCKNYNLELLLVSRLGGSVLEILKIFRLTYEIVETYHKYLTSPLSYCKKNQPQLDFPDGFPF